jgi:hypothetical protein
VDDEIAEAEGSHEPTDFKKAPKRAVASGWAGSALEYYDFFVYATAASLVLRVHADDGQRDIPGRPPADLRRDRLFRADPARGAAAHPGLRGWAGWMEIPSRVRTLITCADKNALP